MSESTKEQRKDRPRVKEQRESYIDRPERFEIIGGVRYDFLSSPKFVHQKILQNLYLAFHTACRLDGEIILAPMDVHFDEDNVAQPDLIYIRNENRGIIRDGFVYGVPDLVVEILSESTGRKDKTVKKAMFEQFGVPEYWIVDPVYRTVDQLLLADGRYGFLTTISSTDTATSPAIPCLSIDLSHVFPPEEN